MAEQPAQERKRLERVNREEMSDARSRSATDPLSDVLSLLKPKNYETKAAKF